jgi:hypothetical protein
MHAPVLLQDLPAKTMHRLLKSVTWTEVDAVFPANAPLRRVTGLIVHSGLWLANLRKPDSLLKFRRAIAWLCGYS